MKLILIIIAQLHLASLTNGRSLRSARNVPENRDAVGEMDVSVTSLIGNPVLPSLQNNQRYIRDNETKQEWREKLIQWRNYRRGCDGNGCMNKDDFLKGLEDEVPRNNAQEKDEDEAEYGKERETDWSAVDIIQGAPIILNRFITCVGTTASAAHSYESAIVAVPKGTRTGDLLVMFIGGSAKGKTKPGNPSGGGWTLILEKGPPDINLMAVYKEYVSGETDRYTVPDGKNTFVILVALRGVDIRNPVVDSGAYKDYGNGKMGQGLAPSVLTEDGGCVIGSFMYDDPHRVKIINDGFDTISSFVEQGDGMAAGISPTSGGKHKKISAIAGSAQNGGGNEVGMAVSFRRK